MPNARKLRTKRIQNELDNNIQIFEHKTEADQKDWRHQNK